MSITVFLPLSVRVVYYTAMDNWNIMYFINENLMHSVKNLWLYFTKDIHKTCQKGRQWPNIANVCATKLTLASCVGLYFSNSVLTGLDWKLFSLRGRSVTVAISLKTFLMNGSCPSQCWHNLRYIFYVSSVKPWRAIRPHAIQHMSIQL